jgi:rubrerythrin
MAQAMREAAIQRRAREQQSAARSTKVQSAVAVRQSPRAESSVMQTSRDVRQLLARSMREESYEVRAEGRRRFEEQQAAYSRELARRSEYIRQDGNSIRENFRAIA